MSALIRKVIGLWKGADGGEAEVVYDGEGPSGPESWAGVDSFLEPRTHYRTAVEMDDGTRCALPVNQIADILPDRTGVLVLFTSTRHSPEGTIAFPPPHNAAIFNADGSLRFQLKNPWGERGSFRAVLHNHLPDGSFELGVRACPRSYPVCEDVYIIDGTTDDLSKQTPRWVRD